MAWYVGSLTVCETGRCWTGAPPVLWQRDCRGSWAGSPAELMVLSGVCLPVIGLYILDLIMETRCSSQNACGPKWELYSGLHCTGLYLYLIPNNYILFKFINVQKYLSSLSCFKDVLGHPWRGVLYLLGYGCSPWVLRDLMHIQFVITRNSVSPEIVMALIPTRPWDVRGCMHELGMAS